MPIHPKKKPKHGPAMTREQRDERLRQLGAVERQGTLEGRKAAAKALQMAMQKGQLPHGLSAAEIEKMPVVERVVEPGRETPRGGTDERHKQRGKLKLIYEYERPSLNLRDVFKAMGTGLDALKLNTELSQKFGASGVFRLLEKITAEMPEPKNRNQVLEQREFAISILSENSKAIWPNLWFSKNPDVTTVLKAINSRKRIVQKFISEDELDKLADEITRHEKFPGWLAIEGCEAQIDALAQKTPSRLTAKQVIDALSGSLHQAVERLNGIRKASEVQRAAQEENERIAQQAEIMQMQNNPVPRYGIQSNTVRFRVAGGEVTKKTIYLGRGYSFAGVIGPKGEPLTVAGDIIRRPTNPEAAIIIAAIRNPIPRPRAAR
ncbi:MAG TPA: hypothetical protein VJG83_05510 [archaeon]|nr:hypothetical protein [archaeon]